MKVLSLAALPLAALLACCAAVGVHAAPGSTEKQYFQLPEMAALDLPFSDAILVDDTLYISGSGGIDVETMSVPDDPSAEARLMLNNVRRTLALADMTMEDLVAVTVYCSDLTLYEAFNNVYREFFEGPFPTRAFIGSGDLLFGMRFELQGVAIK